jgi:hypothetical protein
MNVHTYKKDLFDSYKKRVYIPKGRKIGKLKVEVKEPKKEESLSKKQVYNVLRSVMPEGMARKVAGYSRHSNLTHMQAYEGTVAEIRERIQNDPELGFLRQIKFYAGVRDSEEKGDSDRIAAAKQLDVIAGYNAPAKVEIHERKTLVAAVRMLHEVRNETGMSAVELKRALEEKEVQEVQAVGAEVVEENVHRGTSDKFKNTQEVLLPEV